MSSGAAWPLHAAPLSASHPSLSIGASAVGLEAITELLSSLPSNTGMAYIAAQHLNPDHESLLSEILALQNSELICSANHRTYHRFIAIRWWGGNIAIVCRWR